MSWQEVRASYRAVVSMCIGSSRRCWTTQTKMNLAISSAWPLSLDEDKACTY